ncbi:MAG: HXXEE domain-containing protein [Candidatus Cryptobacteroides sp.]
MKLLRFISYNWYKYTIVAFILIAFYMMFAGCSKVSFPQLLLVASLMSLLVHQWEEYCFPKGGPAVINYANFSEKENFRNYPGNMLSSMIVNVSSHVIYIIAIFFPQAIWLGIAIMFFNLMQLPGHGLKMNIGLGTWYNPGLFSAVFLLLPTSVVYLCHICRNSLVCTMDWVWGTLTFILMVLLTVIAPVQLLKNKARDFIVPEDQVEAMERIRTTFKA